MYSTICPRFVCFAMGAIVLLVGGLKHWQRRGGLLESGQSRQSTVPSQGAWAGEKRMLSKIRGKGEEEVKIWSGNGC